MIKNYFGDNSHPWATLKTSYLPGEYSFFAQQVHGSNLKVVEKDDLIAKKVVVPEVDALVTKLKNVNLVLKTADCIPILFADSKQGLIAAAHAGRQGVQANICQVVVRKMLELSAQLENIIVEMGPAICDMHYQVSEDIQTEFEEATAVQQLPGFIQLKKTIRIQLNTLGITNKNILNNNICTFENPNYFSYRFNRTKQRQFSYIVRI